MKELVLQRPSFMLIYPFMTKPIQWVAVPCSCYFPSNIVEEEKELKKKRKTQIPGAQKNYPEAGMR